MCLSTACCWMFNFIFTRAADNTPLPQLYIVNEKCNRIFHLDSMVILHNILRRFPIITTFNETCTMHHVTTCNHCYHTTSLHPAPTKWLDFLFEQYEDRLNVMNLRKCDIAYFCRKGLLSNTVSSSITHTSVSRCISKTESRIRWPSNSALALSSEGRLDKLNHRAWSLNIRLGSKNSGGQQRSDRTNIRLCSKKSGGQQRSDRTNIRLGSKKSGGQQRSDRTRLRLGDHARFLWVQRYFSYWLWDDTSNRFRYSTLLCQKPTVSILSIATPIMHHRPAADGILEALDAFLQISQFKRCPK